MFRARLNIPRRWEFDSSPGHLSRIETFFHDGYSFIFRGGAIAFPSLEGCHGGPIRRLLRCRGVQWRCETCDRIRAPGGITVSRWLVHSERLFLQAKERHAGSPRFHSVEFVGGSAVSLNRFLGVAWDADWPHVSQSFRILLCVLRHSHNSALSADSLESDPRRLTPFGCALARVFG